MKIQDPYITFILLFCFSLLTVQSIYAQENYQPGYVILENGDTISGMIKYQERNRRSVRCQLKKTDTKEVIEYTPYQIKAYYINNEGYFIAKELEGKKRFFEFLIDGKINIYFLRDDFGKRYFIENEELGFTELSYKEDFVQKDGKTYRSESKRHQGILTYYMKDAPELTDKILSMSKPEHKSLIGLVLEYHDIAGKNETCILYGNIKKQYKIFFHIAGGLMMVPKMDKVLPASSIYFHFWLPDLSKKAYLKTGLNRAGYSLQLEYIFSAKILNPYIAFGLVKGPEAELSSLLSTGIYYNFSKKDRLSINYDFAYNFFDNNDPNFENNRLKYIATVGYAVNIKKRTKKQKPQTLFRNK